MRLYCFPHASAGVSGFARWTEQVGPDVRPVPVLLPGRDGRRREPRLTTRRDLMAELLRRHGAPEPDRPYALYGHSLGGLIAYTVALALERAGLPAPALVAVGACEPPDVPSALAARADAPEAELVATLRRLGAVPEGAPDGGIWRRAVLPVFRDDLRLAHTLRQSLAGPGRRPLRAPLLLVSGAGDPLAGPATMAGWGRFGAGPVVHRTLPGDHFFVRQPALPRLLGRACRVVRRLDTPPLRPTGGRTLVEDSR